MTMEIDRPARPARPRPTRSSTDPSSTDSSGEFRNRRKDVELWPVQNPDTEGFNYEADLKIDPHYLDAEFLNHPLTFMKYAKVAALANKAAKQAEENVKTIRSLIIKREKEANPKHTESTLEAAYRLDPDYREAKAVWVEATFHADLFNNAIFAFQARKSALENLVRLHGQEYFSTPQEPRDLPEAAERLREIKEGSAINSMKEHMKRR